MATLLRFFYTVPACWTQGMSIVASMTSITSKIPVSVCCSSGAESAIHATQLVHVEVVNDLVM